MWLNICLNFNAPINERLKKARMAEAKMKRLSRIYRLFSALVKQIQVAEVQSVALYGAKICWKNPKNNQNEIQKLINQKACSITGMYLATPVSVLISKSG